MSASPATSAPRVNATVIFALASIALLAYTDWVTHREMAVAILLGVVAAGIVLFRDEIVQRLGIGPVLDQVPGWLRPLLAAVPAVLYFLVRGQGISGAGAAMLVVVALTVFVGAVFGPAIDAKLVNLYRARDRMLPRPLRLALALILPVLIAFLVVHGSLADLPALFGGTANRMTSATGREGLFLLGALLSSAVAFLLMRGAVGEPAAAQVPPTQVMLAPAVSPPWAPTHAVPAGGAPAWGAPDPAAPVIATLQAGLPLRVVGWAGDWAQVKAENGWTGWVDGRRLATLEAP